MSTKLISPREIQLQQARDRDRSTLIEKNDTPVAIVLKFQLRSVNILWSPRRDGKSEAWRILARPGQVIQFRHSFGKSMDTVLTAGRGDVQYLLDQLKSMGKPEETDRLTRTRQSLEKINKLMSELRQRKHE